MERVALPHARSGLFECLARAGQFEKAQLLFEKLLGYANHLGLYSEELGANEQHLSNFPQAFTHLALISAATTWTGLSRERGRVYGARCVK